jgi:hypothetical protein
MSADTGVGPAHGVGEPGVQWEWPLLPMMPMKRHAAAASNAAWSAPGLSA